MKHSPDKWIFCKFEDWWLNTIWEVNDQSLGVFGENSQVISPKLFPLINPINGYILNTLDGSWINLKYKGVSLVFTI